MVRICGLAAVVVLALVSGVSATPIGPDCPTCFGNVYTLEVLVDSSTTLPNGNQVYQVTFTIDTSQSKGQGTYLKAIAFKVSTDVASSARNQVEPPSGDWSLHVNTDLISSACSVSGPGSAGIVCSQTSQQPALRVTGGVYQWVFQLELDPATLLIDPRAGEVKALFVNRAGKPKALTSEPISFDIVIVD